MNNSRSDRASIGSIAGAYVSTSSWQIVVAPLTAKSASGSFPLPASQRLVNRASNNDASSSKFALTFSDIGFLQLINDSWVAATSWIASFT